jgi:hypothetical protein
VSTPQAVSRYDVHDLVRFIATFVSTDGLTPADPSTVTFLFKDSAGSVGSYQYVGGAGGGSITRINVGAYAKDVTLTQVGSSFYRWEGTGGVQAAEEWSVFLGPSFIL